MEDPTSKRVRVSDQRTSSEHARIHVCYSEHNLNVDDNAQYKFIGYGGRKRAKLNWPLFLATASLDSSGRGSFLAESLNLDFKNHFMFYPENVRWLGLLDLILQLAHDFY